MKISVVTISFNQAPFLRDCIESVLNQAHENIEYIVVDPGSTDESRSVIESYGDRIIKVFEQDEGPADGLNKGFRRATGEALCFLNSDDVFLDGAFRTALNTFADSAADVIHGHACVISASGVVQRKVYSDRFNLKAASYGSCILIQPSAFFRRRSFDLVGGFNKENRSNWDGELFVDMGLAGQKFHLVNKMLSCYRVYGDSITGSGKFADLHAAHRVKMYEKIAKTPYEERSRFLDGYYRFRRRVLNYKDTTQRILHGPVFQSGG